MLKDKKDIFEQRTKGHEFSETFSVIALRAERIASAVFFISNFFKDSDPVGLSFKESSAELTGSVFENVSDISMWKRGVLLIESKISSQLHTALIAGIISQESFTMLRKEIETVTRMIKDLESVFDNPSLRIGQKLSSIFANMNEESVLLQKATGIRGDDRYQVSDRTEAARVLRETKPGISLPGSVYKKDSDVLKSPAPRATSFSSGSVMNDRKEAIVNVLKTNSNLTVKDFTAFIKDCSEKTIQRELVALVASGSVEKHGERRWTRYSLPV